MSAHLAVLREEPRVSASAIGCYLRCPQQYRFRYVDRLAPEHRSSALLFGSVIHQVLAAYYSTIRQGIGPLSERRLLELFHDRWTKAQAGDVPVLYDKRHCESALRELGARLIEAFAETADSNIYVVGVEETFSICLDHPATGEALPTRLVGVFDLVVQHNDGRYAVVEHKTAARRWSKQRLENDLQVTLYTLAAPAVGLSNANVYLQLLLKTKQPTVERCSLERSECAKREAIETIAGVLSAIDAGAFYRLRDWHCRSCPFAAACLGG
jgi:putative RecB family exonuclease